MAVAYPLNTVRYNVASLLAAYGAMNYHALVDKTKGEPTFHSPGEVRAALIGLRRAGLADQGDNDKRWKLTASGAKHWQTQHAPAPAVAQPPRGTHASHHVCPIDHPSELLTRGMSRLSSPADRLPMVYRPGSLDSANLPRISGPFRVWPDGRSERIDGRAA